MSKRVPNYYCGSIKQWTCTETCHDIMVIILEQNTNGTNAITNENFFKVVTLFCIS